MNIDKESPKAFEGTENDYLNDISYLKKRLESLKQMKDQTTGILFNQQNLPKNKMPAEIDISQEELNSFEDRIIAMKKKLAEMETANNLNNSENTGLELNISKIDAMNSVTKPINRNTFGLPIDKNTKDSDPQVKSSNKSKKRILKTKTDDYPEGISGSVNTLNFAIDNLLKLFSNVDVEINDDYEDQLVIKLDAIIEQNNYIISQNDKIIYALTSTPIMQNIVQKNNNPSIESSFDILKREMNEKNRMNINKLPLVQNMNDISQSPERRVSHQQIRNIFGQEMKENIKNNDKNKSYPDLNDMNDPDGLNNIGNLIPRLNIPFNFDIDLPDTKAKPLKMNTAPKPLSFFDDEREKTSRRI